MKLSTGQVTSQACSFIRSVIVARLISPENYGIAAVFMTTFVLMEQISNLAADKLLIQAKDGDEPAFQRSAQLVMMGRGFSNATVLFVFGGLFSHLFGSPQAVWAFRAMALLPLCRAFTHLDMSRYQRHLRFGPAVLVDVSSNLLGVVAALPLALLLRNYWAMLWILAVQQGCTTLGSHLVAERRWAVAWNRQYARRMFHFGWPLLINGLLLYGIMEGDRVVIGSAQRLFHHSVYTLTDLGVYSVAFGASYAPATLIVNVTGTLFLPILSRAKESWAEFQRSYLRCLNPATLLAAMAAIPFIVGGGWAITLVYGHKYAAAGSFIGWLGAMWGVRIIRAVPTAAALAQGDSKTSMVSNFVRSAALLGMLLAAATGAPLVWISISGFCGESLALGVTLWRLKRLHAVPIGLCIRPFAVIALGMLAAALAALARIGNMGWTGPVLGSVAVALATLLAMMFVIPELRLDLFSLTSSAMRPVGTNVAVPPQA
jgi:O-antigen/teichoic acid export membrane protein